jgi:hypothetical protein
MLCPLRLFSIARCRSEEARSALESTWSKIGKHRQQLEAWTAMEALPTLSGWGGA